MPIFNYVRVLSMFTERRYHTKHGLHLNKKGKDWIVSNLVKEIRNLYLPHRISSPIVLPWRDLNENVIWLAEPNKGCYWSRSDLTGDFVNQIPPVMVNDDMECPSLGGRNDDCQKLGDSAVSVGLLSQIDVKCMGKTSEVNDDLQEVVTICRSTRLKNFQILRIKTFNGK